MGGHSPSPQRGSFVSDQKRQFLNEEDNTFLPPALSSYTIALLRDNPKRRSVDHSGLQSSQHSGQHYGPNSGQATITSTDFNGHDNGHLAGINSNTSNGSVLGIYEMDFPDANKRKENSLKRFSVHFNRDDEMDLDKPVAKSEKSEKSFDRSLGESSRSFEKERSRRESLEKERSRLESLEKERSRRESFENERSRRISLERSRSFEKEKSIEREKSFFDRTNERTDRSFDKHDRPSSNIDDVMDVPGSSSSPSTTTTPGSGTLKRMRGSRRFGKVLGPPKRTSRVSDQYDKIEIEVQELEEIHPQQSPFVLDNFSPKLKESNLTSAAFMKALIEKKSPLKHGFDPISLEREADLRKRVDEEKLMIQLKINKENMDMVKKENDMNSLFKKEGERIPLNSIPINQDAFRKPKPKKDKQKNPEIINNQHNIHQSQRIQEAHQPQRIQEAHQSHQQNPPRLTSSDEPKKKSITINGKQYEKLELLGRGGSSKVYKVKAPNSRLYAIKKVTFDLFEESCVEGFKGEIDLLIKLKEADRVVKLIDHAIGEGSIYLVMECGDIDLAHVLQTRLTAASPKLDVNFVKYHTIEILKCVEAVHLAGIVHSDLKPANFLFVRGILKIIDFGIANAVPEHTANIYRESQIGTPNYMAPEALVEINQNFPGVPEGNIRNTWKVGKPSDVWSCGCILYQMTYGKPPYGGYSGNQRIMAIMNPQIQIAFPNKGLGNVPVPQAAIEMMENCLARNPLERWTIVQCLNCDFLKPKVVSENFIRDLVHLAVNYGYNKRINGNGPVAPDVYDTLVDSVLKQIENLNYG